MPDIVLVNNVEHQDLRIITDRSARYGDAVMQAQTFPFEFRNVQAFYPILFQQDGQGGYIPVALFGFQHGENLFLSDEGWQAGYVPAMVRREPFLIGFQDSKEPGRPARTRVLSLDVEHPRVSRERGEPLFQPLGGRTPFLEEAADLLETIYLGLEHSRTFVRALVEHDLIEAVTLEIVLRDGSRNQLIGYHCLTEERVQALSGATLGELNAEGYLMPLFMALASMANVQRLVDLKNQTLNAEPAGALAH
ncbi:MAG: SapC family protein [Gammaproteobacteria bacterium]|nr:SapC family protein [Gammaproteobacteria bacterium]